MHRPAFCVVSSTARRLMSYPGLHRNRRRFNRTVSRNYRPYWDFKVRLGDSVAKIYGETEHRSTLPDTDLAGEVPCPWGNCRPASPFHNAVADKSYLGHQGAPARPPSLLPSKIDAVSGGQTQRSVGRLHRAPLALRRLLVSPSTRADVPDPHLELVFHLRDDELRSDGGRRSCQMLRFFRISRLGNLQQIFRHR